MLVRSTLAFALSIILILQIFSVTQFGITGTGITGSQEAFAQTTGSGQPSYTLYQNNNEGVSIEYPSDWSYSEQTQGGRMITAFSPYKDSPTLVELFYDKNTAYVGTDQQKLDRLPQIISKVCSGASIARLGFACSDFQYRTGIDKYRGIPIYIMTSSMTEAFSDGSSREQDMAQFLVITQNSDYGILVSCPKDECDSYTNELNHFLKSLNIYSVKAAANDYSNYSLLQGEWIKYKMYLKVESNDNLLRQQMQDTMAKLFSGFAGQQVKSFDDIDWIKSTVTSVSTNEITTHGEAQVLGKHVDIGDYSLDKSPSSAIPTGAKVGDTFDSPLSSASNPSKITVTDIKTENILGNSVDVYELTSSKTTPGDTMTTQMNQVVHYDAKTGILLDWTLGMKIYNSTTFANVEFGVVPIEWSQLPGASAQTPSYNIPSWIKNTAKWWSEGSVTDDDFVKGIQYLIQQGIIAVPTTQVSSQSSQTIPSWVKNTAKWWSEGQLGDADFIKGIQYLVQNGIISTTPQTTTPTQVVTYTDRDGITLNVLSIPGQVLLFVSPNSNPDDVNQMISSNGGTILSQDQNSGYYVIKVDDVEKFISSSYQYDFVVDSFPNEILTEYTSSSSTSSGYIDLTKTNWKDVTIPTNTKVLLVQIDDFVYGKDNCNGQSLPHGVCVSRQNDLLSGGIGDVAVLRLQDQHGPKIEGQLVTDNLKNAVSIAEKFNVKLVVNLSLGKATSDENGNLYPDAEERVKTDIKHFLDPVMNTQYFKDGNVIISQAAPDDHINLSKINRDLQTDQRYGTAYKSYITTSQTKEDENGNQILTTFVHGATSAYGDGVVFVKRENNCGGGTSCAVYGTSTMQALLWSWYPDIKSDQMNDLIRSNTKTPQGGSYPVVDLKNAFLTAWQKYKCISSCPNFGQSDNKINQLQQNQQPTSVQGGNQGNPSNGNQGNQGRYGGYNTPDAYCKGNYGSDYYYDPSRNVCAPRLQYSNQGSSGQGTDLTGQWTGTASGTIVYTDPDPSYNINCNFRASISLDLQQNGKSLTGSIAVTDLSLAGQNCDQIEYSQFGGDLQSTIFGSGFSGTAGPLSVSGQFTSDLMRGRYSGDVEDHTINGDFTASRAG